MTEIKTERLSLKAIQAILDDERRLAAHPVALCGESTTRAVEAHLARPVETRKVLVDEDLNSCAAPFAPGPLPTFDQALRRGQPDSGKEALITMLTVSVMSLITILWTYLVF